MSFWSRAYWWTMGFAVGFLAFSGPETVCNAAGGMLDAPPLKPVDMIYPGPPNVDRIRYLGAELKLRARCHREKGVFLWSGRPEQAMRCWKDVCVRREEGCLGADIIWEVDPEEDDLYLSGAY